MPGRTLRQLFDSGKRCVHPDGGRNAAIGGGWTAWQRAPVRLELPAHPDPAQMARRPPRASDGAAAFT